MEGFGTHTGHQLMDILEPSKSFLSIPEITIVHYRACIIDNIVGPPFGRVEAIKTH